MMSYLAGIDLGSTTLKAVIYDLAGNVVASASRPTEQVHPDTAHPEWTVWLPDQIWGGSAAAMQEAVAQLDDPRRVKGVAVTGMGMDGVPVDEEGQWLYPFISWHCPRTQPQFDWWSEHITAEKTFAVGGNTLWRFSTALRLLWMAEHEPDILRRTYKWLLIEDFVNLMLCGKMATDYTMASCTLLFDQRRLDWSDEMLGLTGIDRRLLAEARPSGTLLGEVTPAAAGATGLPAGTPVVLGGHDYLCGALPVGAIRPGVVLDVSGTWEIVLATTREPVLTPQAQRTGVTVEAHVARDLYAIWGGAVSSDMLEWYRQEFGFEARYRAGQSGGALTGAARTGAADWDFLMAEAAAAPAGAHGVMFLPHLSGAGCPAADPLSRGGFVGLSNQASRGDLIRAVVEGLDYQFLDIVQAMRHDLAVPFDRLVVVGGATKNRFWMQNKADMVGGLFSLPLEVPAVEEATPLGAALLAGIGTGLYRDEQDAFEQVYRPSPVYEPDPAAARTYAGLFPIYQQLYPALKAVSHELATARHLS
jgi:xylulokinase